MRRILYLSSSGTLFGGAELCLLDMVRGIRVRGWTPVVVVPFRGALSDVLEREGIEVEVVDLGTLRHRSEIRSPVLAWRLATSALAILRLWLVIHRRDIDIVHSNTAVVVAGGPAAWLAGRPHVWHVREIPPGLLWEIVRRLILKTSASVVCISEAVATHVAGGAAIPARVRVIRDGVDIARFGVDPLRTATPRLVGMVARIHPHKGHALFLRAAAKVVEEGGAPVRFTIVGNVLPQYRGRERQLRQLAAQLGLDGLLEWRGHVERAELPELLQGMSVVVVPSTWPEGGGLVVLEAMACGRPVVATRIGGPAEVIDDCVNGYLVSATEPDEMAARIQALLRDPALASRVGAQARQTVEAAYSLERSVDQLADLYQQVAGAARRPSM